MSRAVRLFPILLVASVCAAPQSPIDVGLSVPGTTAYPQGGMRRLDRLQLPAGDGRILSAVADPTAGYAYLGMRGSPGRVVKVALGSGAQAPRRVAALVLEAGENDLYAAVIDSARGYAYFGTGTDPAYVVKVELGSGDDAPRRVGAARIDDAGLGLYCAVIDADDGHAYFGTWTAPGRVAKIAAGAGENPPSVAGQVELASGEDFLFTAAADPADGYAYFGTGTQPGRVVKVALGRGDAAPGRVDAVTLEGADGNGTQCAAIDAPDGYVYFGTWSDPGRVVKVAMGADDAPPLRIGATPSANDRILSSGVIDAVNDFAWFGTFQDSGFVVKFALGAGDDLPVRLAAIPLDRGEENLASAVLDGTRGQAYFGTRTDPANLVRVAVAQQGFIKGLRVAVPADGALTQVRLYSHAAEGNVRLALYDDASPRVLRWQSQAVANTVQEGWLTVPVTSGTPSQLSLPEGTYWLCWQVDTMAPVPSYTPGVAGEGFYTLQPFGPFPASLGDAVVRTTAERWSVSAALVPGGATRSLLRTY